MSDLQDALDYWSGMEEMSTCDRRHLRRIVDAARLVANPNYEAAASIMVWGKLGGKGHSGNLAKAKRVVDAALTEGDTHV